MPPPTKKSLLRDCQPSLFLNRALLELYFLGGVVLGGDTGYPDGCVSR